MFNRSINIQLEAAKKRYMSHVKENYVEEEEGDAELLLTTLDSAVSNFLDWVKNN